ncbi:MAG: PilZ domain-containing protein [Candidatus Omnitrophota bacterium]|jgi:c-di-GMP-binding flagellar brake protein YcgR
MKDSYQGPERRKFIRMDYATPLAYKVCKKETLSELLKGYTSDISQSGLLCSMKDKVSKDDIVWLSFDRATLSMCRELEQQSLIYQNGVIGKVVRVEAKDHRGFNVGIQFITRKEENLSHIYPKIYFLKEENEEA